MIEQYTHIDDISLQIYPVHTQHRMEHLYVDIKDNTPRTRQEKKRRTSPWDLLKQKTKQNTKQNKHKNKKRNKKNRNERKSNQTPHQNKNHEARKPKDKRKKQQWPLLCQRTKKERNKNK